MINRLLGIKCSWLFLLSYKNTQRKHYMLWKTCTVPSIISLCIVVSVHVVEARISKHKKKKKLKTDRLDMLSYLNSGLWFERDFGLLAFLKIIYFKVLTNTFRNLISIMIIKSCIVRLL